MKDEQKLELLRAAEKGEPINADDVRALIDDNDKMRAELATMKQERDYAQSKLIDMKQERAAAQLVFKNFLGI